MEGNTVTFDRCCSGAMITPHRSGRAGAEAEPRASRACARLLEQKSPDCNQQITTLPRPTSVNATAPRCSRRIMSADNLSGTMKRIGGSRSDHWNEILGKQAIKPSDSQIERVDEEPSVQRNSDRAVGSMFTLLLVRAVAALPRKNNIWLVINIWFLR